MVVGKNVIEKLHLCEPGLRYNCTVTFHNYMHCSGLCSSSKFDTKYTWSRYPQVNGRFSFRGYTDSVLTYDNTSLQWFLTLHESNETYGYTNITEYPFGTLQWHFRGDTCDSEFETVELSFNACNSSEFNCRDGTCIHHALRCDEKVDCPDKSGKLKQV